LLITWEELLHNNIEPKEIVMVLYKINEGITNSLLMKKLCLNFFEVWVVFKSNGWWIEGNYYNFYLKNFIS